MGETIGTQTAEILVMVFAGACIGFVFDFYRVLRGKTRPGRFGTVLGDLLFWLAATLVVFVFMVYTNYGDFRFYVMLGVAGGVAAYRALLSRIVVRSLAGVWGSAESARRGFQRLCWELSHALSHSWRRAWPHQRLIRVYRRIREWAATKPQTPANPPVDPPANPPTNPPTA